MFLQAKKIITRSDLRNNLGTYYVFGDNMLRKGYGGQAAQMRGEPNAIGIPTKYAPGIKEEDYFTNESLNDPNVREAIESAFLYIERLLSKDCDVVWPANGIGTGRAELAVRAPLVLKFINQNFFALAWKYGRVD